MTTLAHNTIVQYRSRLKTMKKALELEVFKGEELLAAQLQVIELEKKLGPENVETPRKPGRPRKFVKITMADLEKLQLEAAVGTGELTPAEMLRAKLEKEDPEFIKMLDAKKAALEESERALVEMQKLANEEVSGGQHEPEHPADKT